MIDIRRLREETDAVRAALAKRADASLDAQLDRVLELDVVRRSAISEVQELKATRNQVSKQVGELKRAGEPADALVAEMKEVGDRIDRLDADVRAVPRIGVDYAGEAAAWPLRFVVAGHPAVSVKPPERA